MATYFVYCVTNAASGKRYIGRTTNPKARWRTHVNYSRSNRGFLLHEAMRAAGVDSFRFSVLSEHSSLAEAMAAEASAIALGQTTDRAYGYNVTAGGDDMPQVIRLAAEAKAQRGSQDPLGERARNSARGKKAAAALSQEVLAAKMAKARAAIPPDVKVRMGHRMVAALGLPERQAKAHKANQTLGPEGRSERARKAVATLGPEGLSARAKKVVAAQTPEQRSEARRKAWQTRRQNRALHG